MFKRIFSILAGLLLFSVMLYAASTAVNLSDTNRTSGLLPIVRAGTGSATTSPNFILSGPLSGGAAAYSFKIVPTSTTGFMPLPLGNSTAICEAVGSAMTCMGDVADSSGSDTLATSTLPSFTSATSDTTGAGCGTLLTSASTSWYSGRNLTFTAHVAIDSTSGVRDYFGLVNGGNLFCGSQTNIANAIAVIRFSSTTPDTTFIGQVTDGVGTNVVTCNTGVSANTSFHDFKIFFDNANSQVSFFVDDMTTPGCSIASNFDATLDYHWLFVAYCNTCGGVAKNVNLSQFALQTTTF